MATLLSRGAATRVWFAKIGASQVGEGLKKNKTKDFSKSLPKSLTLAHFQEAVLTKGSG